MSEPPKPPDAAKTKMVLPDYKLPAKKGGGRGGGDVLRVLGPPNSYIRGGGANIFETDDRGLVVRQFTSERIKTRAQNTDPKTGQVYEFWSEKDFNVGRAELDIIKKLGKEKKEDR
jgi:hypothetical protein